MFYFRSNIIQYIHLHSHPSIWSSIALKVGFTFLNLRMDVYSTALVSWMDKELADLWIPFPPFPLPAPLLMVPLPRPLPRPPWMKSKHICKAVKSLCSFPAVADESHFSILLFFLLHRCCKHRMLFCCLEEFGGDNCQSSSITSAFLKGGDQCLCFHAASLKGRSWCGQLLLWLCVLAPSPSSRLINNLKLCNPHFLSL